MFILLFQNSMPLKLHLSLVQKLDTTEAAPHVCFWSRPNLSESLQSITLIFQMGTQVFIKESNSVLPNQEIRKIIY